MIIELNRSISEERKSQILENLEKLGIQINEIQTNSNTYFVANSNREIDIRKIGNLDGIADVFRVNENYKLVSRQWKVKPTTIRFDNGASIGNGELCIISGPCAIESEEQVDDTIAHLLENNIKIMRGGVFKPRSSPYSFRGLGIEGLKFFYEKCRANNIKLITEVMEIDQIDQIIDYVDIFQVGARNSQNFPLLEALGKTQKPILLKRGLSGSIDELLFSAEYIFSNGNENIILCERGIRTYEKAYRNTFDINAIPVLKEKSHLPVIADPSHGIGIRRHVEAISLAATIAGADGLIVETHKTPEKAFSDGFQNLNFSEAKKMYDNVRRVQQLKETLS